ncbi:MAG: hypothetical protein JXQ72_17650 [Anaerolineae bacterium]|nr:hypothetical protein [Anaerolineae bacterium]
MSRYLILLAVLLALILAACADEGSAPDAVEKYLKAKIASDADKLVELSCKAWEAQAQLDAAPFESVNAELQDMSCKDTGKDGEYTLVTCAGTLVIEYRGEDPRQQDLSETTYRAIKEDGEWRMCGEQ